MKSDLERYVEQWSLSDPEPLAQTFTSHLYKVQASGQTVVLKILSGAGVDDERAAPDVLKWYGGHGAIRLLRYDPGAMLLEYAGNGDLTELVKAGKDDEATQAIADVLNKLHFASQLEFPDGLATLTSRFESLFKAAELQDASSILTRGAALARVLLADQGPTYVLHGDVHHENIRHHQGRGWLAIDPKGISGERAYDAANALCNPDSLPGIVQNRDRLLRQARIMATALDIDRDRLLSYVFAHACLSACWSVEDGHDPSFAIAMAQIAETCIAQPIALRSRRSPDPSLSSN